MPIYISLSLLVSIRNFQPFTRKFPFFPLKEQVCISTQPLQHLLSPFCEVDKLYYLVSVVKITTSSPFNNERDVSRTIKFKSLKSLADFL